MKKFSIRTLLVLVLALVLVFSLVACGDKNPDDGGDKPTPPPTPTEYTSQEYFENLWNLSESVQMKFVLNTDLTSSKVQRETALSATRNGTHGRRNARGRSEWLIP